MESYNKPIYFVLATGRRFGNIAEFNCYIRHKSSYTIARMHRVFINDSNIRLFQNIELKSTPLNNSIQNNPVCGRFIDLESFPAFEAGKEPILKALNNDVLTLVDRVVDKFGNLVAYDTCNYTGDIKRISVEDVDKFKYTNKLPDTPEFTISDTVVLREVANGTEYTDGNYVYKLGEFPQLHLRKEEYKSINRNTFYTHIEKRRDCWAVSIKDMDKYNPNDKILKSIHNIPVVYADRLFSGIQRSYIKVPYIHEGIQLTEMFNMSEIRLIDLTGLSNQAICELIRMNFTTKDSVWVEKSNFIITMTQCKYSIEHTEFTKGICKIQWLNIRGLIAKCNMMDIKGILFIVEDR